MMAKPLDPYRAKRDFAVSAEPKGRRGKRGAKARFVVQRHDARRLHYDLRLELDGVLKSWAVTRGPSLVAGDKRLSVQTEDHPVDYLAWEGAIPKGQYGGGTMIVWDQGTWTPVGDIAAAMAKGHLEFMLKGERLGGRWHLIRMKGRDSEKNEPWLLIKAEDEFARTKDQLDILAEHQTSVVSGRTNAEMAENGVIRADHAARAEIAKERPRRPAQAKVKGARKAILPSFVEPALATLVDTAPTGPDWLFEIKHDGYRMQARIDGGRVKLLTRSGLDWTGKFAPVANALKALKLPSALIDGEIVVADDNGVSNFSRLQIALQDGAMERAAFHVFDLLYLDGQDLRDLPLSKRKELLQLSLDDVPPDSRVRFSEHIVGDGAAMARHACRLGLEGIIGKRADAPYRSGRSDAWRKIKCSQSQDFVIAGYMPSTTAPRAIGSLILGLHETGRLVHVGRVGTGFTAAMAHELWTALDPLRRQSPPFDAPLAPLARRNARWVEPSLVAEVTFRAWTGDGQLRHAAFKTLRPDVSPAEVARTEAMPRSRTAPRPEPGVVLTHPDRVLWDDVGLTKQGLYEFYAEIADHVLPQIAGRPLSLLRCPDGLGSCFYQKHAWAGMDTNRIKRVTIGSDEAVVIEDVDGLLALVQASVLEIHPWGSTAADPERPDRMIFDLDPGGGVTWGMLVAAAGDIRDYLAGEGFAAFVKTSGGKGLHIVAPLKAEANWATVKTYTANVAKALARGAPDRYVATMGKQAREGRIFIDYLRNQRGATAVAAFSTRARAGAPVSTPVAWDELAGLGSAARFGIQTLPSRLDALRRDPWSGFQEAAEPLKAGAGRTAGSPTAATPRTRPTTS